MDTVRLPSRLFSLCWIRKGLHLKSMVTEPSRAIYRGPSYGPTFGGGHDIYVADNANQNTNSYTIQLWQLLLSSEWSYRPFYNPGWNRLLFTWRGWGILSRLSPYSWRSYVTVFFLIIWKTLKTHWNNRKSWNNGSVLCVSSASHDKDENGLSMVSGGQSDFRMTLKWRRPNKTETTNEPK